eukprot:gnl/TRDRNA2_/TRDRNA2_164616_c2_seq1.p1 gnl/TRDRNA2_/TRDRNA2_164616_c2~~gnl/TRDRNA2_/TRDRNA2_164616_c2_seq1.p1  ORF type:complete len:560 (+),score=122.63 gnl/TRDRNA2_/TRDRNA2_164616_c2_seq1:207-1682(+)
MEVTAQALRDFYETVDASKVAEAETLYNKYAMKTAVLMRVSKQKYSKTPETSSREAGAAKASDSNKSQSKEEKKLSERSLEALQADLQELRAELHRRGAQEAASADDEDTPFISADEIAAEDIVHKVVIIGGGPAGLSAATYAARAGLRPLVVAPVFGGQLLGKGVDVENYPGVVGEHATGHGLVELMRRQAHSFDARFVDAAVLGVELAERPFRLQVNGTERELRADTIILACGAESRWLQVPGEHDFRGKGVSACATCDGFLFRDKDVSVIGGGDTAMEEALMLSRICSEVTLVHRRDSFRASASMANRVLNNQKISILWNTEVARFEGSEKENDGELAPSLTAVHLRDTQAGSDAALRRFAVDAVFVAIGHDPNTGFVKGQIDMDETGYLTTPDRSTRTSVPGVFAAGDVADHTYRQAVTSAGSGSMAALDVERYLSEIEFEEGTCVQQEDFSTWSMKELRQQVKMLGLKCVACSEKSDFVASLRAAY